jgi:hypothetical protein
MSQAAAGSIPNSHGFSLGGFETASPSSAPSGGSFLFLCLLFHTLEHFFLGDLGDTLPGMKFCDLAGYGALAKEATGKLSP